MRNDIIVNNKLTITPADAIKIFCDFDKSLALSVSIGNGVEKNKYGFTVT